MLKFTNDLGINLIMCFYSCHDFVTKLIREHQNLELMKYSTYLERFSAFICLDKSVHNKIQYNLHTAYEDIFTIDKI